MSTEISGHFKGSRFSNRTIPVLSITFAVQRPNGSWFEHSAEFWVDSGNDGDLKMPQSFSSRLKGMGMTPILGSGTTASNSIQVDYYQAKIRQILLNGFPIQIPNEIDCAIACFGTDKTAPLIGLTALSRWKVCLDIPNEILSFSG